MEKQGARYEGAQGISEMTPNTLSPQEKPTVEHKQRVVGHASGWQECLPQCVCGKPWPCTASQAAKCETCDELRKQIAALSKIDERGMGHDDAMSSIASHVHEIQVLCDAFGYDPSQWLQDEVANDCAATLRRHAEAKP
jgi:hypothetical protein